MNGYEGKSAESELAELKELCAKQKAAREELHGAVSGREVVRLQKALEGATDLLLDVEVEWGRRELRKLSTAQDDDDDLPIPSAEQLLAEDEARQREEEARAAAEEQRKAVQAEAAWKKVQDAINADSESQLLQALQEVEGALPPEKEAMARRRIPAMRARAEMRKELATAFKQPDNIQNLRYVIAAAKRSCLPQAEVLEAETELKSIENEYRRRKSEEVVFKITGGPPKSVPAPNRENKAPETKLELAVLSQDKEQIQEALAELKASGMSNQERNRLYACARANYGGQ